MTEKKVPFFAHVFILFHLLEIVARSDPCQRPNGIRIPNGIEKTNANAKGSDLISMVKEIFEFSKWRCEFC